MSELSSSTSSNTCTSENDDVPALFSLIRSTTTSSSTFQSNSVDAIRLYLQYFPKTLPLPVYQERTVLMEAVSACLDVAEAWWNGQQNQPPQPPQQPQQPQQLQQPQQPIVVIADDERLAQQLHILSTVAEHSNLVTELIPSSSQHECRSIFHWIFSTHATNSSTTTTLHLPHAALIRSAVLDLVLEQLPKTKRSSRRQNSQTTTTPHSILWQRTRQVTSASSSLLALHQAIALGYWKAASKLLKCMTRNVRIGNKDNVHVNDDPLDETQVTIWYDDLDAIVDGRHVIPLLQYVLISDAAPTIASSSGMTRDARRSHAHNSSSIKAYTAFVQQILDTFDILTMFNQHYIQMHDDRIEHGDEQGDDEDEEQGDNEDEPKVQAPLISALHCAAPLDVVKLLVQADPSSLSTCTRIHADLPLHVAAASYSRLVGNTAQPTMVLDENQTTEHSNNDESSPVYTLLQWLVHEYPDALTTANRHDQWPLHCAMEASNHDDDDDDDDTVPDALLHLALVKLLCPKTALAAANNNDGDSSIETTSPRTTIPAAAALQQCDSYGDLPLHIACRRLSSVPVETFTWILQSHPDAAREPNHYGHLPLHFAAVMADQRHAKPSQNQPRRLGCNVVQCIELLLAAYPESISQADNEGDSPLHCALTHPNASLEVLQCLMQATATRDLRTDDERVLVQNAVTGQTPLHTACTNRVFDQSIIQALISLDASALSHYDTNGYLPFHAALHIPEPDLQEESAAASLQEQRHPVVGPIAILEQLLYHPCDEKDSLTRTNATTAILPCTASGEPALFAACHSAAHVANTTETSDLQALNVIYFLVERSPELFQR